MVSEFVADLTSIITAIGIAAGVIGSIVLSIASRMKAGKAHDMAVEVGEGLKETDKWVLENQAKLSTVLEVGYALTPEEAKKRVDDPRVAELIKKYNGDLVAVTAELKKLYGPLEIPDNVKAVVNNEKDAV